MSDLLKMAEMLESSVSGGFEKIAEGEYDAQIIGITVEDGVQDNFNEGKTYSAAKLFFAIDYNDAPYVMSTFGFKFSLNSKANFVKIISQMFGKKYANDLTANPSTVGDILGKTVKLEIEHKVSKSDATKSYANILDYSRSTEDVEFKEVEVSNRMTKDANLTEFIDCVVIKMDATDDKITDEDGNEVF